MALTRFTYTFAGERQLSRAFDVLADSARDLREPLEDVHGHLRGVIGEQFRTHGDHGGRGWQDLSEGYKDAKEDRYGHVYPILVATGEMRGAFLARQPLELTARRLVMGPKEGSEEETRAIAHQAGKGNVPARPIVALTTADRRQVDRIFVEYFSTRARALTGGRP